MRFVDVNGTTLAYEETGAGPPAVFVHGFPLDHRVWLDQLEGLGDFRRCVALDLRGFGRSDPTAWAVLTMEALADDVASLITALGVPSADIVALSMGGYVALALWERHPDTIRSLALLDTRSGADSDAGRAGRAEMAELVTAEGAVGLVPRLGGLLAPGAPLRPRARLRGMVEAVPTETIVAALEGMARRPDRTGILAGISVPTLVVVGEEDGLTPPETAEHMAGEIPGARLEVIPGTGHLPPIEAPDAVNEALRAFWT